MNWNIGIKALQDSFEGDIHLDKLHQVLYATDASVYLYFMLQMLRCIVNFQ